MSYEDKKSKKKQIEPRHNYICDLCNYQTPYKEDFDFHYLSHTNETPFVCPYAVCSDFSAKKNRQPQHLLLKPGEVVSNGYTRCLESFSHLDELQAHILIHTGEKLFKCSFSGCGMTFSLHTQLNEHFQDHAKVKTKPHLCQSCKKRFATQEKLVKHLTSHTPKEKNAYQCNVQECDYNCPQYRTLVIHLKDKHQITAQKVFKCPFCSYVGNTPGYLSRHLKAVHKKYEVEETNENPIDLSCPKGLNEGRSTTGVIPRQGEGDPGGSSSGSEIDADDAPCSSTSLPLKKRPRRK